MATKTLWPICKTSRRSIIARNLAGSENSTFGSNNINDAWIDSWMKNTTLPVPDHEAHEGETECVDLETNEIRMPASRRDTCPHGQICKRGETVPKAKKYMAVEDRTKGDKMLYGDF